MVLAKSPTALQLAAAYPDFLDAPERTATSMGIMLHKHRDSRRIQLPTKLPQKELMRGGCWVLGVIEAVGLEIDEIVVSLRLQRRADALLNCSDLCVGGLNDNFEHKSAQRGSYSCD